jgi:hypothetical protein
LIDQKKQRDAENKYGYDGTAEQFYGNGYF